MKNFWINKRKNRNSEFFNNVTYLVMMFFQSELGLSVLDLLGRFADSGHRTPLQKQETERDRRGTRPLPLRCLSQFFTVEMKINCLENEFLCECLRTFHLWSD